MPKGTTSVTPAVVMIKYLRETAGEVKASLDPLFQRL